MKPSTYKPWRKIYVENHLPTEFDSSSSLNETAWDFVRFRLYFFFFPGSGDLKTVEAGVVSSASTFTSSIEAELLCSESVVWENDPEPI